MTYCESTSSDQMALHCSAEQMVFLLDLLNSIEHPTATELRRVVDPEIRSHDRFEIQIHPKIEVCQKCQGEGIIEISSIGGNHGKEDCYKCKGKGRRKLIVTKRYENIAV